MEPHKGVIWKASFDGTTRLGEAFAIVARYVSEEWTLEQRPLCIQMLAKSMTGEEIAREVISTLSVIYSVTSRQLLGVMRDRASINNVASRMIKIMYPKLLDIGCYSHTFNLVGEKFRTCTSVLCEFTASWISLYAHSPKARLLWQESTGQHYHVLSH